MNKSNSSLAFFLGLAGCAAVAPGLLGQTSDALIDKLVEKGILSVREANELREETDKGFAKAYQLKSGMPDWVTALKFNGDFRGRYELNYADDPAYVDRHRYRYRLRFGATATLIEDFEVGLRLASANLVTQGGTARGGSAVSANTDLGLGNSRKFIFVDAAYGKWTPIHNADWTLSGVIGKFDNPFALSSMVFDPDIQLEGAALQAACKLNDLHTLKFNGGFFVLDEFNQAPGNPGTSASHDPYMLGAQLLWESKWTPKIDTTLGISKFTIARPDGLNNTTMPNASVGNTRLTPVAGTTYAFDYEPFIVNASVTYKLESFPGYSGEFPIKVAGEYMHNPDAPSKNIGWWGGVTFGKAGKKGLWEVFYRYQWLGGDAWYEEFPDDDNGAFYQATHPLLVGSGNAAGFFGGTNIKGHLVKASYSVNDFVTASLSFYMNELIVGSGTNFRKGDAGHLMVDLMWKF
jgi:hypothetical protein